MKNENDLTTGISRPDLIDEFIRHSKHPMLDTTKYLRTFILSIDKKIGEGIFWKAPVFYYTGKMKPFIPKEYKRYIVGFNLFKKDEVRLIFLRAATAVDNAGILIGDYKDGRRLASFSSVDDVKRNARALRDIIKQLLENIISY